MEQPMVDVIIRVKQHTVDYNRLMEYLRKVYQRDDTVRIEQTDVNPLVSGQCEHVPKACPMPKGVACAKCGIDMNRV